VWVAYWCAPPDAIKLGYLPKTCRMWPPEEAPQAKLGLEAKAYLRRECQRLQADCDRWLREHGKGRMGSYSPSLLRLIELYQRDPESTFANLRQSTRETYIRALNVLERDLAGPRPPFPARLPDLKALDLKRQYERWAQPDSPGEPRKIDKAHALIGMVKVLLKYAVVHHDCEHAQRILGQLAHTTFSKGGARKQSVGREQARAIIKAAHAAGYPSIALAQAIAFETGLRPRDVLGEWVPLSEPGLSAVTAGGEKWQIGLTWAELSPDGQLTHRLSKSIRGRNNVADLRTGKTLTFDVRSCPLTSTELARVLAERRNGPMVVCEDTGLPWRGRWFRVMWRRLADAAGLPADLQFRDSRSGAITEGIEASGGDIEAARVSAGHSDPKMTARYSRNETNRIADLAKRRAAREPKG
jgi:integrase